MQPDAVRVLIVEDSETDFELMVHALRRSGFAVTAVRVDREPALTEALRSFAPDIVLSDHALPQASGREVLQAIQREQPMLPVLIVTGSIDEETAADDIKCSAATFIVKQRLHRLGPAVRRALALKAALRDAIDAETALEASEQRFRSLIEHSSDVITLLDEAGTIMYSTQTPKTTMGYAAGERTGTNVREGIKPHQQPPVAGVLVK